MGSSSTQLILLLLSFDDKEYKIRIFRVNWNIMFAATPFVICHNLAFIGGQKTQEESRQGRAIDVTA